MTLVSPSSKSSASLHSVEDQEVTPPTGAILLIGDELLTGKVKDENALYLIQRLRGLGVQVGRVVIIPDDAEEIASEVQALSRRFDHVFTSGGVGPTHDDITLESIALAFGVKTYLDERLSKIIHQHFGARVTQAHLRMANIPMGAHLIWPKESSWPVYTMNNVYILPGVPQIFRAKFESIADRFRVGTFYLRSVYLNVDEGGIAASLAELEDRYNVSVGSYPRIDRKAPYRVRVTIESLEMTPVNQAVDLLIELLTQQGVEPSKIVEVDPYLVDPQHSKRPDRS